MMRQRIAAAVCAALLGGCSAVGPDYQAPGGSDAEAITAFPSAGANGAAAVMVAVFFTFALSGPLPPKAMGSVLGIAVLLDAVLVRRLLVPVLLRVVGAAAWWRPRWLGRILPEVRFGH